MIWGRESINASTTNSVENSASFGTGNFLQTPTWSFSYEGPDLLDSERTNLIYSILLTIRPAL